MYLICIVIMAPNLSTSATRSKRADWGSLRLVESPLVVENILRLECDVCGVGICPPARGPLCISTDDR